VRVRMDRGDAPLHLEYIWRVPSALCIFHRDPLHHIRCCSAVVGEDADGAPTATCTDGVWSVCAISGGA
jgi:hypothetical protein